MEPWALASHLVVLFGGTFSIMIADKSFRSRSSAFALSADEPAWIVLIGLTLFCNIAALPFYFFSTRRSVGWGVLGLLAFSGLFGVASVVGTVVQVVTVASGSGLNLI